MKSRLVSYPPGEIIFLPGISFLPAWYHHTETARLSCHSGGGLASTPAIA